MRSCCPNIHIVGCSNNCSLVKSDFFDLFKIQSTPHSYFLRTCAGVIEIAVGFQIKPVNGGLCIDDLLPLIECNEIPNNRSKIPTPEAAFPHAHLKAVAAYNPKLDLDAQILLLFGRDLIRVHNLRSQINGPLYAPFSQRLDLVLIGEACHSNVHRLNISAYKTAEQ